MRVADLILSRLVANGVRHVFLVTGGGAMHLNDAVGRCREIEYVCCHHEQACTMAAEAYARISGRIGIVNVTAGPGAVNALNGVFGAWTDSVPMLVLSGQVKRQTLRDTYGLNDSLRQLGDQEVDIVRMVQGITKYAATILDPNSAAEHLDRALHAALTGRPGPVWLDVPVDVQSAEVPDEDVFSSGLGQGLERAGPADLSETVKTVIDRIAAAERPVVLAGSGVRAAGAVDVFHRVVERLGIPVTTAWTHDLIPSDHPLFCGRPGTIGERAGNFTVQNSDLLLVIGSRLNVRQVSYNWEYFARAAFKIQVDVDEEELRKPLVRPDLPVVVDARVFLLEMERQLSASPLDSHGMWLQWCQERRRRFPVFQPDRHVSRPGAINPYHFIHELFRHLDDHDVIVCGDATACIVTFQVAELKAGQRLFSNSGSASMGYDLPAAIGAAVARGGQRVICLAGDGSLQMNIQELQTVAHHGWPIKLFVLNNAGYVSIRQTQSSYFGLAVGSGPESGVSFPDFERVAGAYGLSSRRIQNVPFGSEIDEVLATARPEVAEVMLDATQGFEPKLSSRVLKDGRMLSSPLEDMSPFLSRDELAANMIVPVLGNHSE